MTTSRPTKPANAQTVERNLDLVHGFVQELLDNPEQVASIPEGVAVVLLPEDDPAGFEENLVMAIAVARNGREVYLRHVRRGERPQSASGEPKPTDRE